MQQWPKQERVRASGQGRIAAHAGEAADAGSTAQAHRNRFRLVVEMVRGQQCGQSALFQPCAQSAVADRPRLFLNRGRRRQIPLDRQDGVLHLQLSAKVGDHLRFVATFLA